MNISTTSTQWVGPGVLLLCLSCFGLRCRQKQRPQSEADRIGGAFVSLIGWTMIFYLYGNMHVQGYVYCRVNIHARYYYYKINPILFKINSHKRPSEDTDGLFFVKKRIVYTEKDEPQPQVVSAFGLRMTN